MKNKKLILAVALVLGLVQLSNAQIAGSKHDFSTATWNNSSPISSSLQGQKCRPCHAPHNSVDTATWGVSNAPLWDHRLSTATYTVYSGYSMNATVGQPDGMSKLCLSCHDNTVALASFRAYNVTPSGTAIIGSLSGGVSNLGTDLSNDHPVSFVYDASLASADGKLYDPTTQASGLAAGNSIDVDMLEPGTHKVQCTSCHDPHNGGGAPHLLVKSNTASALCMTCHNK